MSESGDIALTLSGIGKTFAVPVLEDIHLVLDGGRVHGLIGGNGAGKSTLCNIISGRLEATAGTMSLNGTPYTPTSVRHAEHHGIRMVMQELHLLPSLSVAENLFISEIPHKTGFINFAEMFDRAECTLAEFGLEHISPQLLVAELGLGEQQMIAIARTLSQDGDVLILDEPTAALTDPQAERVFESIAQQRQAGKAIVYVSHRLEEVRRLSNRIIVLRDGHVISDLANQDVDEEHLIHAMSGTDQQKTEKRSHSTGTPALRLSNLRTDKLDLKEEIVIHQGEIFGVGGLVGSGRTELLNGIFGVSPLTGGRISMGPGLDDVNIQSPADAVALGMGLIPEDRKHQGLMLSQSIEDNISLANLEQFSRFGFVHAAEQHQAVDQQIEALNIRCLHREQPVSFLSGGNQQKALISRWLLKDSDILLFDEPTRGIDVGAKRQIYRLMRRLAEEGKTLIVVSSESDELSEICDRILVISNGRFAALFDRDAWTADDLTRAAFSGYTTTNVEAAQ